MFCTICATANRRDAAACTGCGARLARPAALASPPPARRPARRRGLLLARALPLVLALGLVGVSAGRALAERELQGERYREAETAVANGDLLAALATYRDLAGYRDARARADHLATILAPLDAAIESARAAADDGRFAEATATLLDVIAAAPGHSTAIDLLASVRESHRSALAAAALSAELSGDWLAAESALRALAALEPLDQTIHDRLQRVLGDHGAIVLSRDGAIVIAHPDGTVLREVTTPMNASWPVWSPDRASVAFIQTFPSGRDLDGALYVVPVDGSEAPRRLADRVLPFNWVSWSPDSTRIAFSSTGMFDEDQGNGRIELHVVDVATGAETDLTDDRLDYPDSLSWSPDSREIAFVGHRFDHRRDGSVRLGDGETYLLDITTGLLTDLSRGRIRDEVWATWSPAGDRLLIFTSPGDWTNPEQSEILLLDLQSGNLENVPVHAWELSFPVWSPDGGSFAYVEGDDVIRVWRDGADQAIPVSPDIAPFISWSPDGSRLFAAAEDAGGSSTIITLSGAEPISTTVDLDFDLPFGDGGGPPQWAPRTVPASPSLNSLTGAALDPA